MADFEGTKELNLDENVSLEELGRLRLENRDLQLTREKLVKKLDKKKNELENERTNTITLRQFIQELNRKVELLERDKEREVLLLQQIACLEGDNAKLQEEFDRKPSKQELIAELDDTQNKVTELLRKCNSLQKTKNEIEDTLQTELKESRDEVFLLKTETNQQKETIDKQNEVIETYKQRLISEEEYKASETKDKQISHLKMVNLELEAKRQTCDTHILELNEVLQQSKSDYKDLDDLRKQFELESADKCSALEDDKSVLEIQVDVLNGQIGELSEERERWKGRVVELETTLTDIRESCRQVLPSSKLQVNKSPPNPKLEEKDKSQSKGKDSKSRYPEPSAGATSGATNMNLTPEVITQANKTGKSSSKMTFRGVNIHVIKLKAFPNPTESYNKQVIYPINKRSELGVLICIIDLPTKVGLRSATTKYAGIKLYNPVGNCDGAYKDKKYFDCPPNCGIFVPLEDVYVPVP